MNATASSQSGGEVQGAFRALADPTRREILMHLSEQDMTIGELTDQFTITRAAVKKHLLILEQGALISVQVRGRERINHLEPQAMAPIRNWLDYFSSFWDEKLNALDEAINNEQGKSNDNR